eukprot:scaffold69523_cov76-Phaeocystis_antarctica.AAC.1
MYRTPCSGERAFVRREPRSRRRRPLQMRGLSQNSRDKCNDQLQPSARLRNAVYSQRLGAPVKRLAPLDKHHAVATTRTSRLHLALRAFSALSTHHSALTNSLTTHCSLLTAAHPDDSILLLQPHMQPIAAEEL